MQGLFQEKEIDLVEDIVFMQYIQSINCIRFSIYSALKLECFKIESETLKSNANNIIMKFCCIDKISKITKHIKVTFNMKTKNSYKVKLTKSGRIKLLNRKKLARNHSIVGITENEHIKLNDNIATIINTIEPINTIVNGKKCKHTLDLSYEFRKELAEGLEDV